MINQCYIGDCIEGMAAMKDAGVTVQTCITSPPYWGMRDYGHAGAYGLEDSLEEYIDLMVQVFRAVRDILADDGTIWVNMGDAYSGSWGNYGGQNRGSGSQRNINTGSQVANKAHSKSADLRPPASQKIDGIKPKDMIGMPWMLAFALRADGWFLRQDIIWHKPAPMPESTKDRCTKAHEYLFLLSKNSRYYYDYEAMQEPVTGNANARGNGVNPKATQVAGWDTGSGGHSVIDHNKPSPKYIDEPEAHRTKQGLAACERKYKPRQNSSFSAAVTETVTKRNRRSVWTVAAEPYAEAHFATFPTKLIEPCVLAGSRPGDVVLDPFMGSGTTAQVAEALNRKWIGCEINPDYVALQADRLQQRHLQL